jgi:hypothetical protein
VSSIEHQIQHYEVTARLWFKYLHQRNFYYFVFVLVASIATIFTHGQQNVHSVLAQVLAAHLRIPVDQITAALPFKVVYCFLAFCVVFALTMLCHRGERTQHLASYLGRLEKDIRSQDGMAAERIAFTYFHARDSFYLSIVSWVFLLLLVTPVVLLMFGGLISHLPLGFPDLRSWSGTLDWFRQTTFEFWIDAATLAIVGLLLFAYLTRGRRHG